MQRFRTNEAFWATKTTLADDRLASGPIQLVFAPDRTAEAPLSAAEVAIIDSALRHTDTVVASAVEGVYRE